MHGTGQSPAHGFAAATVRRGKSQQAAVGSLGLGREVAAWRVLWYRDEGGPLHLAAICSMLIRGLPAAAFERNSNVSPHGDLSSSSARVSLHSQGHMPVPQPALSGQGEEWLRGVTPRAMLGGMRMLLSHPHTFSSSASERERVANPPPCALCVERFVSSHPKRQSRTQGAAGLQKSRAERSGSV